MEFAEILKQQADHRFLHVGEAIGGEDMHDLACQKCYLIMN